MIADYNNQSGDAVKLAFDSIDDKGSRVNQEDYCKFIPMDGKESGECCDLVFILADGIGGCAGGKVASKVAVEAFVQALGNTEAEEAIPLRLLTALKAADVALGRRKQREPEELSSMGCTMSCAWIRGRDLYYMGVGDSPIFLMQGNKMRRLNLLHNHLDDTLRDAEQRGASIADLEAIRESPDMQRYGSMLTSYLNGGGVKQAHIPALPIPLNPGDSVLVSSDGILTMPLTEIAIVLRSESGSAAAVTDKVTRMVNRVLEWGNPRQDNVTFGVIEVI